MLYFYEIFNLETFEHAQGIAHTFAEVCKAQGWKPQNCHCVWKASVEASY